MSVDGVTLKREFVTLECQKLEVQSLVQRMKSVVRRGGVQLLQKELSALKVFELRSIAMELGVASTGLKTELQERLSTCFSSQDSGDESNIFDVLELELHGVSCVVWKSCLGRTLSMVSRCCAT